MAEIESLISEAAWERELQAALAKGVLPEKFFYASEESVAAWLDLCREGDYKNFSRSKEVIEREAQHLSHQIPGSILTVVSLGAGQGDKDLILLEALRDAGKVVSYLAVDASRSLLSMAIDRAERARFVSRGIRADLTNEGHWKALEAKAESPRLFLLLGNTLGGFDPIQFAAFLKKVWRPGDFILVDGEIFEANETLAGYDNPVNRRFAFAPLKALGFSETDGDLNFEIRTDPRRMGLFFVHKFFVPKNKGKTLMMSPSYKYEEATLRQILTEDLGGRIQAEYWSGDRRLLMILAAR